MNWIRRSTTCLICDFDMTAPMTAATVYFRAEWARQIANGICDECSRLRHGAAVEFDRAATGVRLLLAMGADWRPCGQGVPRPIPPLARAIARLKSAEHECVRLKMWPANERSTT